MVVRKHVFPPANLCDAQVTGLVIENAGASSPVSLIVTEASSGAIYRIVDTE